MGQSPTRACTRRGPSFRAPWPAACRLRPRLAPPVARPGRCGPRGVPEAGRRAPPLPPHAAGSGAPEALRAGAPSLRARPPPGHRVLRGPGRLRRPDARSGAAPPPALLRRLRLYLTGVRARAQPLDTHNARDRLSARAEADGLLPGGAAKRLRRAGQTSAGPRERGCDRVAPIRRAQCDRSLAQPWAPSSCLWFRLNRLCQCAWARAEGLVLPNALSIDLRSIFVVLRRFGNHMALRHECSSKASLTQGAGLQVFLFRPCELGFCIAFGVVRLWP